jgi:hypothetical protein
MMNFDQKKKMINFYSTFFCLYLPQKSGKERENKPQKKANHFDHFFASSLIKKKKAAFKLAGYIIS